MSKKEAKTPVKRSRSRARTPEERENELINLVYDVVEQRIRDGTATGPEYVHFLKMGSTRERKEKEALDIKMRYETAKTNNIQAQQTSEERTKEAIRAFTVYSGGDPDEYEDDEDDLYD